MNWIKFESICANILFWILLHGRTFPDVSRVLPAVGFMLIHVQFSTATPAGFLSNEIFNRRYAVEYLPVKIVGFKLTAA